MINVPLKQIDKTVIENLISNEVRESRTLDYKEQLPGHRDHELPAQRRHAGEGQKMANHESVKTTKLYDRSEDDLIASQESNVSGSRGSEAWDRLPTSATPRIRLTLLS